MRCLVFFLFALSFGIIALVEASERKTVNLLVRSECLTAPVRLEDCDLNQHPPHCAKAYVRYRESCAEIQLTK
jgi:hypothetical protein